MFVKRGIVSLWNVGGVEPSNSFESVSLFSFKQPDQVVIAFYSLLIELSDVVLVDFSQIVLCKAICPEQIAYAVFYVLELASPSRNQRIVLFISFQAHLSVRVY